MASWEMQCHGNCNSSSTPTGKLRTYMQAGVQKREAWDHTALYAQVRGNLRQHPPVDFPQQNAYQTLPRLTEGKEVVPEHDHSNYYFICKTYCNTNCTFCKIASNLCTLTNSLGSRLGDNQGKGHALCHGETGSVRGTGVQWAGRSAPIYNPGNHHWS